MASNLGEEKSVKYEKTISNGITMSASLNMLDHYRNTTELDLSNRNIERFDEDFALPENLQFINLSQNKLTEVPKVVACCKELRVLDLSHNNIEYFNEAPSFCHALEVLKLSHNQLRIPPTWVWTETPKNLIQLDMSCNVHISELLTDNSKILQLNAPVTHVLLYNCRLGKCLKLLGTFTKTRELELGTPDWSCYAANYLQEIPCQGLDKCCDIEKLNLSNTHIYTITPSINMYRNLKEINLSHNNLNGVPSEFCELENLEICILSFNSILYLPDNIVRLKKLTTLCLDVNELCMIPQNISELDNLKTLDLYDNNIYEYPEGIRRLYELDLAQNYLEEPDDGDYMKKREKLRLKKDERQSGRKYEVERPESDHSPNTTDDEELMERLADAQNQQNEDATHIHPPSSPEDWDSDWYWAPQNTRYVPPSHSSYWLNYVTKKMEDGNLCPMDAHTVSIAEQVKYKQMCYPEEEYESDGQFDDFSGDDS